MKMLYLVSKLSYTSCTARINGWTMFHFWNLCNFPVLSPTMDLKDELCSFVPSQIKWSKFPGHLQTKFTMISPTFSHKLIWDSDILTCSLRKVLQNFPVGHSWELVVLHWICCPGDVGSRMPQECRIIGHGIWCFYNFCD